MAKLTKCPKCGSSPRMWFADDYFAIKYLVKCNRCGLTTARKYLNENAARAAWDILTEGYEQKTVEQK